MKLSLLERFVCITSLPSEGDFATLRIVRGAKDVLAPSEAEYRKLEIRPDQDGKMLYNAEAEKELGEIEMPLSPAAIDLIKAKLLKLEGEKRLTEDHLTLYEKLFM